MNTNKSSRIIHVTVRPPNKRAVHPLEQNHSINQRSDHNKLRNHSRYQRANSTSNETVSDQHSPTHKSSRSSPTPYSIRSSITQTNTNSTNVYSSFTHSEKNDSDKIQLTYPSTKSYVFNNQSRNVSKANVQRDKWAPISEDPKSKNKKKKRKCACPHLCLLISILAILLLMAIIAGTITGIIISLIKTTEIMTTNNTRSSFTVTTTTTLTNTSVSVSNSSTLAISSASTLIPSTTLFDNGTSTLTSITTITSTSITTVTTTTITAVTTTTASTRTTTTKTTTTTTAPSCTTRIGFDDIANQSSTSGVIPDGYYNLNWTNMEYINASTIPSGGYQTSVSFPPYVAHNPSGLSMTISSANGTRFFFNSFNTTAAWRDNLQLNIQGYRSTVLAFNFTTSIFASNETIVKCSSSLCSNLDTVVLSTWGGTIRSGVNGTGTEMIMDDFCVTFGF